MRAFVINGWRVRVVFARWSSPESSQRRARPVVASSVGVCKMCYRSLGLMCEVGAVGHVVSRACLSSVIQLICFVR